MGATIGGAVATGLSGPRRPYAGAVRDFVLGTRIVNGKGEDLSFGGRVIKNVAGYDVSRLMAGALGCDPRAAGWAPVVVAAPAITRRVA